MRRSSFPSAMPTVYSLVALLSCVGVIGIRAAAAAETFTLVDRSEPPVLKPDVQPLSATYGVQPRSVPLTALEPLDMAAVLAEDEAARMTGDKTRRYGMGRDVIVKFENGSWTPVRSGGQLWAADVSAAGAVGIRLHFNGVDLPPGAQLVVYGAELPEPRVWAFEGRGWFDNGEFWTPTVFGERARIELFLPGGEASAAKLPAFVMDRIQHIYLDPVALADPRAPQNCADVSCYSAWATVARACAGVGTVNQNSLWCSGQLINASNSDQTPYWITANHCISTVSGANSAEVYWLYQTSSCNGSGPSLASVPQSAPCTFLWGAATPDTTLLMVEGTIPRTQIAWVGWTSTAPANGTASTCIHHPAGYLKRISFGLKQNAFGCGGSQHIGVDWNANSDGTEGGSSGSGIFRDDTQQFFGQLHCGPSSCESPSTDDYGSFASAYANAALQNLLAAGSDDALEQNDTCETARVTSAGSYSNLIVKSTDEDFYRFTLPTGATLNATVTFTHSNGDIDLQLQNPCGSTVASSTTTTNSESISYLNNGASAAFNLRVFLAADTRNGYSMTITINCPVPGPTSGVSASDGSSCSAVKVTWNTVPAASEYWIMRNTILDASSATQIGTIAGPPYMDNTATVGVPYYYWVRASSGCGTSTFGTADSGIAVCGSPGDFNCDGLVNGDDIQGFVNALISASTLGEDLCHGDYSGNAVVDAADEAGMVSALLGI